MTNSIESILEQYENVVLDVDFYSDDSLMQQCIDVVNGTQSKSMGHMLNRAIYNYLNCFIEPRLEVVKEQAESELLAYNEKHYSTESSEEYLSHNQFRRNQDEENRRFFFRRLASQLKMSDFAIKPTSINVKVSENDGKKVVLEYSVDVTENIMVDWRVLIGENEDVTNYRLDGFVLETIGDIIRRIERHNENVENVIKFTNDRTRERVLVVEFYEAGINFEGAIFNGRLLEKIHELHKAKLRENGYDKLYIGVRFLDDEDSILQLNRFDMGSTCEFDELVDALHYYKEKYDTLPFNQ